MTDPARHMVPVVASREDSEAAHRELRRDRRCPPLDPDVANEVLLMIASGTRITHLADLPNMPPYAVINAWRAEHAWFDEAVVQASEAHAEDMLYQTLEIADDQTRSPACREVSIRARQYAQKVLNRKRYDPATRVEVTEGRDARTISNAELERLVATLVVEPAGDPGSPPAGATGGVETKQPSTNPPPSKPFF